MTRPKRGRVATAIALTIAVTVMAGCTTAATTGPGTQPAGTSAPAAGPSVGGTASTTATAGGDATLSEPVTAGGWTISVVEVRGEPLFEGKRPQAGNEYLVLNVNARNDGAAPAKLSNEDFTLTDASGAAISPRTMGGKQWVDGMDAVAPGASASAIGLMFDVPKGSTGLKLHFIPPGVEAPRAILVR